MIKTTKPQIVDAQNNIQDIVYFIPMSIQFDFPSQKLNAIISVCTKIGDNQFRPIRNDELATIEFKMETVLASHSELKLIEFIGGIDQLMIQWIEWANQQDHTISDALSKVQFWQLKATDLEIVK